MHFLILGWSVRKEKTQKEIWKRSLELRGLTISMEPENNKVWLQSQHGSNGGRKIDFVARIKREQEKSKNL